ncbi:MAG: glycosyltransferase family 2 protein [Candidatus Thorarchaeota archaeon]
MIEDDIGEEVVIEGAVINVGSDAILEPIEGEFSSETLLVQPEPYLDDITAVVVNYQTDHLIKVAVESFREFYPTVRLVIVDNHSTDGSRIWIRSQQNEYTRPVLLCSNKGHGPALHNEFKRAETKFVFTFDSDVEFLKPGLLEQMRDQIGDAYATGWLRWVNHSGVSIGDGKEVNEDKHCPYIHPYCALYDRDTYLTLDPFVNKGAPAIDNMRDAKRRGLEVVSFETKKYVKHLVAGTRRMWRGHWYPGERKPERQWDKDSAFPI